MLKKILSLICILVIVCSLFSINVSANQYVYVKGDVLNIRSGPSTAHQVMGQAYYGDSLIVYGKEGNWYLIYYWGVTGYVSGDYVSFNHPDHKPTMGEQVVAYAKTLTGIPYVYGGNSPSEGFDCSGFVKYVFKNFGVNLPRTSYSQMNVGTPVTREQLMPGDLVVFRGGGHVGIYCGDNIYIHAPQSGRTITAEPMNRELYCARRIVY